MQNWDLYENFATTNVTAEDLPGLFSCSNHIQSIGDSKTNEWTIAGELIAGTLLLGFIIPDVVGAFTLFTCPGRRSKAVAVIILFEAVAALSVGALALNVQFVDGPLDSFLLVVGVVFIHDLDKKVVTAQNTMLALYQVKGRRPFELRSHLFCFIFLWTCFIGATVLWRILFHT